MRIRIIFSLKNRGAALPFFHQHLFAEVIEHILRRRNLQQTHLNYHFSGLKGQTRISRKGLHYCSKFVTLVFASTSKEVVDELLEAIFDRSLWKIGELQLEPLRAEQERLPAFGPSMKYICISPLVPVSRHREDEDLKMFMEPDQDTFSDYLYETIMGRMERSGAYTPEEISSFYKFQLVPDKQYLEKVRVKDKKFARIYSVNVRGRQREVRGYTFPLVLHAAEPVQRFVFITGLGDFTEQGFGMLDLAHRDPTERTIPYRSRESTKGEATKQRGDPESDQTAMPSSS